MNFILGMIVGAILGAGCLVLFGLILVEYQDGIKRDKRETQKHMISDSTKINKQELIEVFEELND